MPMQRRNGSVLPAILWLLISSGFLFQGSASQRPDLKTRTLIAASPADRQFPNLGALKTRLTRYHDCQPGPRSSCYEKDISAVISRAKGYLRSRLRSSRKLAVVLDIDETSLSNWEEIKGDDFGFHQKIWDGWVDSAKAPAITATLGLFKFARERGVAVFFITGRREPSREVTRRNLEAAGYTDWAGLVLRPEGDKPCAGYADPKEQSQVVCYKATARKKIVEDGYRIVVNIGDQMSDLRGGYAERAFKLPNPFYYIP